MKKKQILAVLMVIAFIIAALPMSAMAASADIAAAKTALEAAISAAETENAKLEDGSIVESADGTDVAADKKWITAEQKTAFEDALTAAQDIVDNGVGGTAYASLTDANKDALDAATDALTTATEALTNAADGTGGEEETIDAAALDTALTTAKKYVTVDSPGTYSQTADSTIGNIATEATANTVPKDEKWVTQTAVDTLGAAIEAAQTTYDAATADPATATQDEVDAAVTALKSATSAYISAAKAGTKPDPLNTAALAQAVADASALVTVTNPGASQTAAPTTDGDPYVLLTNVVTIDKVSVDQKAVTQAAVDTLGKAITAANTTLAAATADPPTVSQPTVNKAVTTLNNAIAAYENSAQQGELQVTYTALEETIEEANAAKDGVATSVDGANVTTGHKWVTSAEMTALTNAITPANAMLTGKTAETQTQVDNMVKTLKTAIEVFEANLKEGENTSIDYSPLETAIEKGQELLDNTKASTNGKDVASTDKWATAANISTFETALNAAKAHVTAQDCADNAAVTAAENTLNTAIATFEGQRADGLQFKGDYTELEAALEAAKAAVDNVRTSTNGNDISKEFEWVTSAQKAAIDGAISDATIALDNSSTQDEIDSAAEALKAATTTFESQKQPGKKAVDYAELVTAIANAEAAKDGVKTSTDGADVSTSNTWVTTGAMTALNDAITTAQNMYDTDSATVQGDVTAAVAELTKAVANFRPQPGTKNVDYTPLQEKIDEAQALLDGTTVSADGADVATNQKWVDEATADALKTAIAAAQAVIDDDTAADQAAVQTAVGTLNTAIGTFKDGMADGTMEEAPSIENTANPESGLTVSAGQLKGLKAGAQNGTGATSASDLIADFTLPEGYTMQVVKTAGGEAVTGTVGTGMILELLDASGNVVDSQTIIVLGDLVGIGTVGVQSLAGIASSINGSTTLTDIQFAAADMNGDGTVNVQDLAGQASCIAQSKPVA